MIFTMRVYAIVIYRVRKVWFMTQDF